MKRKIMHTLVIFLTGLLLVSVLTACGGGDGSTTSSTGSGSATLSGSAQ